MLRQMVKIANKLDSLGLTKEADVLDRYIHKMAAGPVTMAPGNILYEDGRARDASGASLSNKFYASKPKTLSEFNGLLVGLVEEIGKIPGQKVFSKDTIELLPKESGNTWSGATNVAFKEYAKAAGFPEAGESWKDFSLKNRYQPTLFGIYKFWEDTISKVVEKAMVKGDFPMSGESVPSAYGQASRLTGGPITQEKTMSGFKPGPTREDDYTVSLESAMK